MKHVTICHNPIDPATWERVEAPDLMTVLRERWPEKFPEFARIYQRHVSQDNEVTPTAGETYEQAVERLHSLEGPFFIVLHAGQAAIPYIVMAVLFVGSIALAPKVPPIPGASQRNQAQASPNNELSNRVNRPRLNGRIPDIFGQVESTPDLISSSYNIFENNAEIEFSYMCIGRGSYQVERVRDGDTKCEDIPGTTVQVFAPYTSPNSGDEPQLLIGTRRQIPILRTKRSNSVNGQVLRPPNVSTFTGNKNVRFVYPNRIQLVDGWVEDFTKYFVSGDLIDVDNAVMTAGVAITEHFYARASIVDLRQRYVYDNEVQNFIYPMAGGALALLNEREDFVSNFFFAGSDITLTTTYLEDGGNLNGTYEVESIEFTDYDSDPDVAKAQRNQDVPKYFIVKLVDPASVNSKWNDMKHGGDSWDWRSQARDFEADIQHAGADTTYSLNLNGTYRILSVTKGEIVLESPVDENSDWAKTEFVAAGATPYLSPVMESSAEGKWVGPYILNDVQCEQIYGNLVASAGLYKDSGAEQVAVNIEVEFEVTPVDDDDEPLGNPEIFKTTLAGSNTLKETVAVTLKGRFASFKGRCAVRARRLTEHDEDFEGSVVDEVRWRDLYSVAFVKSLHFGDVTTVQSVVYATASSLAVKERKLNMLVTRKLPARIGSTNTFTDDALVATTSAADAFVAMTRDKYIGNRQISEIDVANIYDTVAEIVEYFGTPLCGQFCYTFDNDNISYQDAATIMAQALFSIVYRRGNVIRWSFEKQTADSVLLFNHRNKIPGSETRTFTFNVSEENDGVELTYVNPRNDSIATIYLPPGYAAINPKKIETLGVRNYVQAYFAAWRALNKINYTNLNVEFEATQEAGLTIRNDRILVTDSTSSDLAQDGDVIEVDGLELTLSRAVSFDEYPSYAVFLQLPDGTVESIDAIAGSASNKIVLASPPSVALAVDPEGYTKAGFVLVGEGEPQRLPFLVEERERQSKMTHLVRARNYDDRYYSKDKDFINEVIDEDGYGDEGGYTPAPEEPPYTPGGDEVADDDGLLAKAWLTDVGGSAIGFAYKNVSPNPTYVELGSVMTELGFDWENVSEDEGAGSLSPSNSAPGGSGNRKIVMASYVAGQGFILIVVDATVGYTLDANIYSTFEINGQTYVMSAATETAGYYTGLGWRFRMWRWATPNPTFVDSSTYPYLIDGFPVGFSGLDVVEGADTFAADGDVKISGTLAVTEDSDTFAAEGGADSPIKALLHFDGTDGVEDIIDETGRVWGNSGAALTDNDPKIGATCLDLSGSGSFIETEDTPDIQFNVERFTLHFWFNMDASQPGTTWAQPVGKRSGGTPYPLCAFITVADDTFYSWFKTTDNDYVATSVIAREVWNHYALVKDGTSLHHFINGVKLQTDTISGDVLDGAPALRLGLNNDYNAATKFYGRIDEFVLNMTEALWDDDFTPPTTPTAYP
jgi:hypothetical protein